MAPDEDLQDRMHTTPDFLALHPVVIKMCQ